MWIFADFGGQLPGLEASGGNKVMTKIVTSGRSMTQNGQVGTRMPTAFA